MLLRLQRLGKHVGDVSTRFIPRTWSPADLQREGLIKDVASEKLQGLWIQKDPYKELGSGISLVRDSPVASLSSCSACVLQRYVEDPFLLDGKKFSLGVYTAFTGVEPFSVWLHRELLILVCTNNYTRDGYQKGASTREDADSIDELAHLSNGLLNRRLNPDEAPECEGCAYNATEQVWTTDRFLTYLEERNIPWEPIERQLRRIILTTFTAATEDFIYDVRTAVPPEFRARLFSHWRFDFLLDASGGAWLLEAEIVPSTGTIGGIDEVIKTVVLRDLLSLVGWGPSALSQDTANDAGGNNGFHIPIARRPCDPLERLLDFFEQKDPTASICDENERSTGESANHKISSVLDYRGPLDLDVDLCRRQVADSWSKRLCKMHLLDKSVPIALATKSSVYQLEYVHLIEEEVRALLRAAGDSMWLDDTSIDLVVKYEMMRKRRLGYEPLFPIATGYFGMDGMDSSRDGELLRAQELFLATKATQADTVLWRWESAKARLRAERDVLVLLDSPAPMAWHDIPIMDSRTSHANCQKCLGYAAKGLNLTYCASLAGSRTNPSTSLLEPTFRGDCQARWKECRDRPTGFVDGVSFKSKDECDALDGDIEDDKGQLVLLWKARAHGVSSFAPLVGRLCKDAFLLNRTVVKGRSSEIQAARREMCSLGDIATMSRDSFERTGIRKLIEGGRPVVIRAERPLGEIWSPTAFADSYGETMVKAMAFNGANDSKQMVYTTEVSFRDFISFSVGSAFSVDGLDGSGTPSSQLSLYLLLTTRGEDTGNANPNGQLSGRLRELLVDEVSSYFANEKVGDTVEWAEAWTSLRLGGNYK